MTFILPSFGASAISAVPASGGGGGGWSGNGYSVVFDGTNDYMSLASTASGAGAYTISFWFKPLGGLEGWVLYGTSGEYISYYGSAYGNKLLVRNMGTITTATDSIMVNNWYHVFLVRDSSNNVELFINGSSAGTSTFSGTLGFSQICNPSYGLNGHYDEFAFFNSDQSANLSSIYNSGAPGDLSSYSPTHWWRMGDNDGGTGTTITDQGVTYDPSANGGSGGYVSSGNDGALTNGPTFSTDVPVASSFNNTYSLSLDGLDDYAEVTGLGLSGATSFSMWINPQASSNFYPLFHADSNGVYIDIAVGNFRAYLYDNTNGGYLTRSYGLNPSLNTWYHLAVTVDAGSTTGTGASASLKLYVNGAEVSSAGVTKSGSYTTFNSPSSNPLDIGARTASSPPTYANQLIDEVAIFGSELSASQITNIYRGEDNGGSGGTNGVPGDLDTFNPVGWWRMGDTGSDYGTATITNAATGSNSGGSSINASIVNGSSGNTSPTYHDLSTAPDSIYVA